jgi:hypothetical protein
MAAASDDGAPDATVNCGTLERSQAIRVTPATLGEVAMDEQKDRGDRGPMDPTRKLLKVFGVKVTDYESKTDELLARWAAANESERATIQGEVLELSADLAHWLREISSHVLERQERVLTALR